MLSCMLEAENSRTLLLIDSNNKPEQSFNIEKLYQTVIFSLEKTIGTNEMVVTYNRFIRELIRNIEKGKTSLNWWLRL